jgi:glycosyltransferase involved in cell wall biosynthesis
VYPDDAVLVAGYLTSVLARRPLVPYFHNTYASRRQTRVAATVERMILKRATLSLFISESLAAHYAHLYPGLATSVVVHPMGASGTVPARASDLPSERVIAFGGNVNDSNADALGRMVHAALGVPDARVELLTATSRDYLRANGLLPPGVEVATVAQQEFERRLEDAAVLLLPHGFRSSLPPEEINTIFPTKVVEYFRTGRPVVAHAPGGSFIVDYLVTRDAAQVVTEPSVDAVRDAIVTVLSDPHRYDTLARAAATVAAAFDPATVTEQMERDIAAALVK